MWTIISGDKRKFWIKSANKRNTLKKKKSKWKNCVQCTLIHRRWRLTSGWKSTHKMYNQTPEHLTPGHRWEAFRGRESKEKVFFFFSSQGDVMFLSPSHQETAHAFIAKTYISSVRNWLVNGGSVTLSCAKALSKRVTRVTRSECVLDVWASSPTCLILQSSWTINCLAGRRVKFSTRSSRVL